MKVRLVFRLPDGKAITSEVDRATFTIGRSSKADVVIPFEGLSREHCQVILQDNGVVIQDLGSPNGIMINDERIPQKGTTPFNPVLQTLSLGGVEVTEFTVLLKEDVLAMELNEKLEMSSQSTSAAPNRSERTGNRKAPKTKDLVETKSSVHPSVQAMLILLALGSVFLLYKQITGNPEDNIIQMQFEANLKNKKDDGTIKTSNF
jgi:pSer/pThr/pTyr-binding forkhead associated (FHA) protein